MELSDIMNVITEVLRELKPRDAENRISVFNDVLRSQKVRNILDLVLPIVDDVTEIIGANTGKILAVRLDKLGYNVGHKQPVVGGLIVRYLLKSSNRRKDVKGFIDGGNVSTALALGCFAKRFNFKARLVMSHLFPKDVLDFIHEQTEGCVETIVSPKTDLGREREFYDFLRKISRSQMKEGFACLWHAKFGGQVLSPLGELLAEQIEYSPEAIVLSIGAGATLQGWALPIQECFGMTPTIVVAEHVSCPLLELNTDSIYSLDMLFSGEFSTKWLRKPPPGIPHMVVGPHYDELNPCINKKILDRVGAIIRYTDKQWKQMASFCQQQGLSVGNSSAVNLLVAKYLAEKGKIVLTFIYEPCRKFYYSSSKATSFPAYGRTIDANSAQVISL